MRPQRTALLEVFKVDQGPLSHYHYTLTTSSAQADLPLALRVDVPLRPQVVETMCAALQVGAETALDHRHRLRQQGGMLYRLLFPAHSEEARLLAARLTDWHGPLVISTNDAQLPWELVYDGEDFLGARLAIGRQIVTSERFQEARPIGKMRRALIVSNPTEDLAAADQEAERLAQFMTEQGIECTRLGHDQADFLSVIAELNQYDYDLFHYSGHVGIDEGGNAGLLLHDQYLSTAEIRAVLTRHGNEQVSAPPVVFLNGCRSAEHLSSVCKAFLETGSRIVMGARYRIIDVAAREFAERWYANLLSGMNAGDALQEARNSQQYGLTGTWAAFILFGQPVTQLWESPPQAAEPREETVTSISAPLEAAAAEAEPPPEPIEFTGPPWDKLAEGLDPDARRVLRRIVDSARDFGIVTSFHLAAGLIAADPALASAVEAAEIDPSTLAEILDMHSGPDLSPPVDANGNLPQASEHVSQILDRAVRLARAADRGAASVPDLASAFAQTGGGHAGELLSMLGIDLRFSNSLFTDSGQFQDHRFAAETRRALQGARLLSAIKGEIISSYSLVMGFALVSSPILREALLDQGAPGESAVRALFPEAQRLTLPGFSARARRSLEQALELNARTAAGGPVGDAEVLVAILADPSSVANQLLSSWGVDPVKLRDSLSESTRGEVSHDHGSGPSAPESGDGGAGEAVP